MKRRLVFFTYYRLVPTGQIGIFKRCMRLIRHLVDDFEIHLVNYGPLPYDDALFADIAPSLTVHDPPTGDELGPALAELLERLAPTAVIIGEAPLRGSMRLSHRVASHLGLWQICIENFYGEYLDWFLEEQWEHFDRWLLLGLTRDGNVSDAVSGQGKIGNGKIEIVPPFVDFTEGHGQTPRDRVTVLGYDKQTLLTGVELLGRLPATERVDLIIAPRWRSFLERQPIDLHRPGLQLLELPGDSQLFHSISRAKLVLGKAGYQQVIECVALGAPIVCQLAGGGVESSLMADYLQPWVRFVENAEELGPLMPEIAAWLLETPSTPWARLPQQVPRPIPWAAERLRLLVDQSQTARRAV